MNRVIRNIVMVFIFIFLPVQLLSEVLFDFETGAVFTGYNDVRIPGDSGTKFSLSDDLDADPAYFYRVSAGYLIGEKHYLGLLAAPLTVKSSGVIDKDITFAGKTFAAGEKVEGTFMFNSYRLTYRYNGFRMGNLSGGIGFTGKIRHASIKLRSDTGESEKKNTGFVPIINFMLRWDFASPLGFLVEGDALASPQGRAEDILFAFTWRINDNIQARAGYRLLEGGADNDEVYTFSMFNYAIAGITVRF